MKKVILLLIVSLFITSKVYAGFNFGTDTYEKVDNILIVNSLGDQTTESKFKYKGLNLGYNDYIPENAFKNDLYNQGYTKVYDSYNPNLDLVEVGYMGLKGNPRAFDVDYVLREEWEKLSSQYQDIRINENKNNISNIDFKHSDWNKNQDIDISKNKNNIKINTKEINNNKKEIERLNNRASKLEKSQHKITLGVRFLDTKKWIGELSATKTINNNNKEVDIEAKFIYKFGKSYTEKRLNELENRIKNL